MPQETRPAKKTQPMVYLAGPEVFLPNANDLGARKKAICARHGFDGVFPLDEEPGTHPQAEEMGVAIFETCITIMNRCDLAIANLTPFRGISMDVGTAVEIGYMRGQGKPVFGYTNSADDLKIRIEASPVSDEFDVEDFGFVDNLMCEGVIRSSGGRVVRGTTARESLLTDLVAFEDSVRNASRVFLGPPNRG
jgi:nucleoside 2-deoxyribosyltransferase